VLVHIDVDSKATRPRPRVGDDRSSGRWERLKKKNEDTGPTRSFVDRSLGVLAFRITTVMNPRGPFFPSGGEGKRKTSTLNRIRRVRWLRQVLRMTQMYELKLRCVKRTKRAAI